MAEKPTKFAVKTAVISDAVYINIADLLDAINGYDKDYIDKEYFVAELRSLNIMTLQRLKQKREERKNQC